MKYESPFDAPVREEEIYDPYNLSDGELSERVLCTAEALREQAASYGLCMAQNIDSATEAYGRLTMASQSDPMPCLSYISSGVAALAWILANADREELAEIADRVNDAMSDMERVADNLKAKHDIEKELLK